MEDKMLKGITIVNKKEIEKTQYPELFDNAFVYYILASMVFLIVGAPFIYKLFPSAIKVAPTTMEEAILIDINLFMIVFFIVAIVFSIPNMFSPIIKAKYGKTIKECVYDVKINDSVSVNDLQKYYIVLNFDEGSGIYSIKQRQEII